MRIKKTERGWCGHLIVGHDCRFHRNTLLEKNNRRYIVSTVGNYWPPRQNEIDTIGHNRYYETMVFKAIKEGSYWDIEATNTIDFDSEWMISELSEDVDNIADDMHETVIKEITAKMNKNKL